MAGLIKREDIDEVRQRTDIKEVVDGYVTLKGAGLGTYKGLCPFHDERSPSFTVRPQVGRYHCFGCGEDGDAISFVQKMDHTSFHEAVEKLAARIGYELRYEDGGSGPNREEVGKRQRLLDAHKIADEFFRSQLLTPGAAEARNFLDGRGFDRAAAEQFGVGYAPQGWDALLKHLRGRGFTDAELKLTGMFSEGNRGIYDRFRGRLIWPIRDIAGDTIGFGARKLYEDDQGPKYLNTPETTLYKKSQVLYGIDLAKRNIAKERQLVVVEGYTDVMACHLSGIPTAVATCGTAFGTEHIKIARRLLSDDGSGGEVIFTFDGDAAGQKAALRAFEEDQRFTAQTYVAVEPTGADPCELRQARGDAAVRELIGSRRPLFEFAIKATLRRHNLDTVEGRVAALREAAPVVAQIRDAGMRPAYTRELAGWLGTPIEEVSRSVGAAAKRAATGVQAPSGTSTAPAGQQPRGSASSGQAAVGQAIAGQAAAGQAAGAPPSGAPAFMRPDPRDPVAAMERQALEVVLQEPGVLDGAAWPQFEASYFSTPAYAAVHTAIRATGPGPASDPVGWVEHIRQEVPEPLRALVSELAVTPLPANTAEAMQRYCRDILARLFELQITRIKADKMGQLQRLDAAAHPEDFQRLNREVMQLEMQRRALRSDS
ncbi:DNA primase [Arthrobacter cavernae]|uniref:DNA primase n=1 Tax=Arthrobacter cavernae TaxID=2817681 RepID=A0A939HC16_9MICC|nr:DNA primase [Arthrobacter cavernae]MBO1266389.1 DNA primase [Arthrobacter cavernae]